MPKPLSNDLREPIIAYNLKSDALKHPTFNLRHIRQL